MATATSTNGNAKTAASNKATTDDLEAQIAALKADVAALTGTLKDMGIQKGVSLKSSAKDSAEALRKRGEDTAADLKKSAQHYYATAESQVRENPAAAIGIAAGVGFLVGLIMNRR